MNLSPTLLHIRGIAIKIHITFVFLICYVLWIWRNHGSEGMLFGVILTLLLFVCVTLHELGHALAARSVGIPVNEILLLPIGGVAFLTSIPKRPWHDLWIAAAGPLTNVLILVLLLTVVTPDQAMYATHVFMLPDESTVPSLQLGLEALYTSNMMLVLFNLLPALPLDGGRIVRATIIMFVGERRGSVYSAYIGHVIAIILLITGFMSSDFVFLFIAYFIFRSGEDDRADTRARTLLDTQRVDMAYNRNAIVLAPNAQLSTVVDYILTSYQPDYAVVQGNNLLGVITRDDVLKALETSTTDEYVTAFMQRNVMQVAHTSTLAEVRIAINEQQSHVAAVFREHEYLGLVSLTDIEEAMLVIESVQNHQFLRSTTL
ncbi:MAG: site-2 protease family protein [Roseiflexaceae bacterium]|jgi:Zn-dependent protease|nr:site-2 protease family protein [Chloroflexaceae bacterium]